MGPSHKIRRLAHLSLAHCHTITSCGKALPRLITHWIMLKYCHCNVSEFWLSILDAVPKNVIPATILYSIDIPMRSTQMNIYSHRKCTESFVIAIQLSKGHQISKYKGLATPQLCTCAKSVCVVGGFKSPYPCTSLLPHNGLLRLAISLVL